MVTVDFALCLYARVCVRVCVYACACVWKKCCFCSLYIGVPIFVHVHNEVRKNHEKRKITLQWKRTRRRRNKKTKRELFCVVFEWITSTARVRNLQHINFDGTKSNSKSPSTVHNLFRIGVRFRFLSRLSGRRTLFINAFSRLPFSSP